MESVQLENRSPSQQEENSHQYLSIKRYSKFSIQNLLYIKAGTLLLAGDAEVGKEQFGIIHSHSSTDVGFQFFSVDFIRNQPFHLISDVRRTRERYAIFSLSEELTTDAHNCHNWQIYQKIKLDFQPVHKDKDQSIGLFLGDLIVGVKYPSLIPNLYHQNFVVVLMKILMEDAVGWICFLGSFQSLELQ